MHSINIIYRFIMQVNMFNTDVYRGANFVI